MLISPPHIHIPQRRLTQRPAVSGLFAHPLDDLIGQVAAVELGAHDAVQEHAAWGLVDVFTRRDQPHTRLLKRPVNLYIIGPVAGQAVQLVDDDVVNPSVFLKVGQHLLQLRAVRRPGRLTPVGELLDHQRTHRLGFALVGLTLSGQREALLTTTTLGLLTGGDTDVGDGPLRRQLCRHGRKRVGSDCRRATLHHAGLCCFCRHMHPPFAYHLSGHTSHA